MVKHQGVHVWRLEAPADITLSGCLSALLEVVHTGSLSYLLFNVCVCTFYSSILVNKCRHVVLYLLTEQINKIIIQQPCNKSSFPGDFTVTVPLRVVLVISAAAVCSPPPQSILWGHG